MYCTPLALANGFDSNGASQLPEPKPLGKDYGQVAVGQKLHLRNRSTGEFSFGHRQRARDHRDGYILVTPVRNKNKDITVRLTLSGVIAKSLLPEKKKGVSF
ncbi:MAG: hypothetical protein WDO73_33340 [Ignavibacteriota bacterium]